MAADRAAVRRGLAVRRAANRPPRGRWKTRGHRPIVAAPGLGSLATALAVVGLGVGVALAKAQRERRSERSRRDPPPRKERRRRPSLLRGEHYVEGLRRVLLGQLDLAVDLLESYPQPVEKAHRPAGGPPGAAPAGAPRIPLPPVDGEQTVHETRKALKRLRALLALLRPELGRKRYARESAALRDCARRLAGARDAEVMVSTLDALVQRHPPLACSAAVRALRSQLHAEREAATALAIRDPRVRGEVLGELRAVRARVERWELRERGFRLLAPGLERTYREGRLGLRTARRGVGEKRRGGAKRRRKHTEALHAWRKHVKDLRYVAETLDRGGSGSSTYTRRVARRADRLGEVLGEEHDLALLEDRVRERSRQFAGERGTRKRLLRLIARRRRSLRKRALHEGERLYRRKPRRFVRRVRHAQ
jgi:CHAD domain-containing protein